LSDKIGQPSGPQALVGLRCCNLSSTIAPGWNIEADEALARFMVQHDNFTTIAAGTSGTECIEHIVASSEEGEASNLLDEDRDSYWESDGQQGEHWLRFTLKPLVVIDSFFLLIDPDDSSYLPKHVVVKAGYSVDDMKQISSKHFSHSDYSNQELNILQITIRCLLSTDWCLCQVMLSEWY